MIRSIFQASCLAVAICLGLASLTPGPALASGTDSKVDLNRASLEELQTLPGIGPSLAARIVDYREKHGPFQRVEDLMNVRGIGEKSFLKLRERVTIGDKKARKG